MATPSWKDMGIGRPATKKADTGMTPAISASFDAAAALLANKEKAQENAIPSPSEQFFKYNDPALYPGGRAEYELVMHQFSTDLFRERMGAVAMLDELGINEDGMWVSDNGVERPIIQGVQSGYLTDAQAAEAQRVLGQIREIDVTLDLMGDLKIPTSSWASTNGSGSAPTEAERQLADFSARADLLYGLQERESAMVSEGLARNMKQAEFIKTSGIPMWGEQVFLPAPAKNRLSTLFAPSAPGYTPVPEYKGFASSVGLPGFAEGTGITPENAAAVSMQQGAPPAAIQAQPMAAPPSGMMAGDVSRETPPPSRLSSRYVPSSVVGGKQPAELADAVTPERRMASVAQSMDPAERQLRAVIDATRQLMGPGMHGLPVVRDITVGGVTIPAKIVRHVGRWSIPIPTFEQRGTRPLQPGEAW